MNILILTGKFGMGHWSASQSLRQQLRQSFPHAAVEVVDFPTYAMPKFSDILYKSFNLMVSHGSPLFNTYYKLTSLGHSDARPPFEGVFLGRLADLLCLHRPDAVIATHPLCAQLVSRLKERGPAGLDLPLITCITDVSSHPEWINQGTDCYLVPNHEIRRELAAQGVNPRLVCVTGIPVREEFRRLPHHEAGKCRELLIMGGGLGLLPKDMAFYDALNAIPDTHTTIITGSNQKLLRRLQGRFENIQAVGYTSRVWDYMSRADLLVTKPGGITLFEGIFARVPILAWPPVLGQERSNARWMAQAGIGWVAEGVNCADEIRDLLQDRQRLSCAAYRMERLCGQLQTEFLEHLMGIIAEAAEKAAEKTTAKAAEITAAKISEKAAAKIPVKIPIIEVEAAG